MGADLMQDGNGFAGISEGANFAAVGGGQWHALAGSRFGGNEQFASRGLDRHGPQAAGAKLVKI
jgi:hypothetical protein